MSVINLRDPNNGPAGDTPAGGGDDGDMRERLAKLEAIIPTLATKADVSESASRIIMWLATITVAAAALVISAVGQITSARGAAAQMPPVVIQMPAPAIAPLPTASTPPSR